MRKKLGKGGVISTVVGYCGGTKKGVHYRNMMDYTEAIQVVFDPRIITYGDMVKSFLQQHTWSRSKGSSRQYRNVLWYHNDTQRQIARKVFDELSETTGRMVMTPLEEKTDFYRAEEYHQKYVEKSRGRM